MTYRFEQRNPQGQVVYQRREEAKGGVTIWDEVLVPGLFIWALFFLGSLGLGFVLVSAAKVPTNNDIMTMLGIAAGVSSISSLLAWGLLWDSYQLRVWSSEETSYNLDDEPEESSRLWQQTAPGTIVRSRYKFTQLQLRDLAIKCFDADGNWQVADAMTRDQLEGIGIKGLNRKYRDIQHDLARLGWLIETAPDSYQWTQRGKSQLWRFYPPHPR